MCRCCDSCACSHTRSLSLPWQCLDGRTLTSVSPFSRLTAFKGFLPVLPARPSPLDWEPVLQLTAANERVCAYASEIGPAMLKRWLLSVGCGGAGHSELHVPRVAGGGVGADGRSSSSLSILSAGLLPHLKRLETRELSKPCCDVSYWWSAEALFCVCRGSVPLVSHGKASEQGFWAEGEVQEPPGAGNIPGKFEVVGGQANRVRHHCGNTQGVRTGCGKGGESAWVT